MKADKESKEESKLTIKFRNDLMILSTKHMKKGGNPLTMQLAMLDTVMEGFFTMHEAGLFESSDLKGECFNERCIEYMSYFVDQWCEANDEEVNEHAKNACGDDPHGNEGDDSCED